MSCWTQISGTIYIDVNRMFESKERLKEYIENNLKEAPKITGSESNADVFVNILSGYNVSESCIEDRTIKTKQYQTCAVITIVGSLRDRVMEQTRVEIELFTEYVRDMIGTIIDYSIGIDDGIKKEYILIEEEE